MPHYLAPDGRRYFTDEQPRDGWTLLSAEEVAAADAPVPTVPEAITMRQARLVLLSAGLLGDVDAAIAALPSPAKEAAQIEWEYAQDVRRQAPLILQLAPALGLTDAQLDAMFVAGADL